MKQVVPTKMQKVFLCSPVNGALYLGEHLPVRPWPWPRGTWLANRLEARGLRRESERTEGERSESADD